MSKFNVVALIVVNSNFAVKDVAGVDVVGSGGDFDDDSTGSNVFKLTKLLISLKTLEPVESVVPVESPPEPATSTPATSLPAKLKLKQY